MKFGAEKWRGSIRGLNDSAELTTSESERLSDFRRASTADLILTEGSPTNGNRNSYSKVYARRTKFASSDSQKERSYLSPSELRSYIVESRATSETGKDSPTYTTEQVLAYYTSY